MVKQQEYKVIRNTVRVETEEKGQSIYDAPDHMKYIITSAPQLGILKSLGIVKNASVYKEMTHRFGGPVLLKVESSKIAIGKDIAEKILVRR